MMGGDGSSFVQTLLADSANAPRLSVPTQQSYAITQLPPEEEKQFQNWIRNTDWHKEFVQEYGEEPDLNIDTYDYRAAWKNGVQPARNPYHAEMNPRTGYTPPEGGRYHWGGFKNPNHPTYWAHEFMNYTGIDPGQLNLKSREEGQQWMDNHPQAVRGLWNDAVTRLLQNLTQQQGGN